MSESDTARDGGDEARPLDKIRRYGPWAMGAILVFMAVGSFLWTEGSPIRGVIAGILFLATAALALPPTRRLIRSRMDRQLAGWMVAALVVVGLFAGTMVLPSEPDDPEENVAGADTPADTPTPSPESDDEEATSSTEPEDEETTPQDTDVDESENEEASDKQTVQLVAEASYDDHGLVTGISPDGNYAAFAMHTGEVAVYDAEAESFSTVDGGISRQPSHVLLQDTGRATVGWMDAQVFGAVDMTQNAGAEWLVEYEGLWNIDTSEGHSNIAAVTSPPEGPGRVGVTTGEGDVVWDQPLDQAASESVAVTDDGDQLAVGGIEYWAETGTEGTPGVRLYDGETGDRQWTHETETNAWAVDVHGEQELVAAATDESLIVLDFDGNVVWQTDEGGLWVAIADDGSTVVTVEQGVPVAYDPETGEEQWRADDAPGFVHDRLAVSKDGDRVVATETVGWTYVVDSGEVVWQEEREDNPANVDISADGATWSVIVQDNDRGGIDAYVYRDNSVDA